MLFVMRLDGFVSEFLFQIGVVGIAKEIRLWEQPFVVGLFTLTHPRRLLQLSFGCKLCYWSCLRSESGHILSGRLH